MKIGVVGINHKQADLTQRELLAKICQKKFGKHAPVHLHHSFLLLSTCNRTEIYFSSEDLGEAHSYILKSLRGEIFEQLLYSFFGIDCFYHLSRVTAGMDSAILWESDIQCQVKKAYEEACHSSRLPKELHFLFQKALHNGKLVRRNFSTTPAIPDLEHAIFSSGVEFFGKIPQKILIVGASAINLKVLSYLQRKGCDQITLCNRSTKRGILAQEKYQCDFLPWKEKNRWNEYDWIIYGTKSPTLLLREKEVGKACGKCIMDLSVPRNVDPNIQSTDELQLFNIDDLHQIVREKRAGLVRLVDEAEKLLIQAVKRQRLKSGISRDAWKGNHVTDILHTGNVLQ